MSFVRAIPGDGEAITTAILAMAHSLGLTVVAEGVENERQLDFLRRAGCDVVQGFLLSKPLAPDEMTAFLLARVAVDAVSGAHLAAEITHVTG
jgi:EAL domain-containing protein (putative c-di-GMP-specific phosphodiesterase class I)